jgi:hypothetical protein
VKHILTRRAHLVKRISFLRFRRFALAAVDSSRPIRYTRVMEVGIGLWVLLAVAVGILASRGFSRSGIGWFVLALIFSPLAGVLLFILPARRRPCPFCAEPIQPSAVVCRFCGRDVGAVTDHPGLPKRTRILLLILIVAVLVIALSQCDYRYFGWRGDAPIQVKGAQSARTSFVIRHSSLVTDRERRITFSYE